MKPDLITSSKYPDIPLLSLSAYNLDHAYLYLHSRDMVILNKVPEMQNWFSHYLKTLPVLYSNGEVTILNTTHVSYPVPNSNTALINPHDSLDNRWWYANDILSQSTNANYTEKLDTDQQVFKSKNVVLSFDPNYSHSFFDNFTLINDPNSKWSSIFQEIGVIQ